MPNVSPKEIFNYYGVDQIIIANIASPQTLRNIKQNEHVVEQKDTIGSSSSSEVGFSGDQVHKDPLFFLEGQLCQHLRKTYQD